MLPMFSCNWDAAPGTRKGEPVEADGTNVWGWLVNLGDHVEVTGPAETAESIETNGLADVVDAFSIEYNSDAEPVRTSDG